eukprot:274395_1
MVEAKRFEQCRIGFRNTVSATLDILCRLVPEITAGDESDHGASNRAITHTAGSTDNLDVAKQEDAAKKCITPDPMSIAGLSPWANYMSPVENCDDKEDGYICDLTCAPGCTSSAVGESVSLTCDTNAKPSWTVKHTCIADKKFCNPIQSNFGAIPHHDGKLTFAITSAGFGSVLELSCLSGYKLVGSFAEA